VKYLLLLANAPDAWDDPGPTGDDGVTGDWTTYTNALRDAGVLVSGAGLHDPDTATAVRVREGKRLLTDGPFAETKEHVVGFYMIDVPDLDSALDWAARVPNARTGVIELRPVRPDRNRRRCGEMRLDVEVAWRSERARLVARLARRFGDLNLGEDAVQDAFAVATATWQRSGVPERPGAWLWTVASRRAVDILRRTSTKEVLDLEAFAAFPPRSPRR